MGGELLIIPVNLRELEFATHRFYIDHYGSAKRLLIDDKIKTVIKS